MFLKEFQRCFLNRYKHNSTYFFYSIILLGFISVYVYFYFIYRISNSYKLHYKKFKKTSDAYYTPDDNYLNFIFTPSRHIKIESYLSQNDCNLYAKNQNSTTKTNPIGYPTLTPIHLNQSINFKCAESRLKSNLTKKKTILIWNSMLKKDLMLNEEFLLKEKCPIKNCFATGNKTLLYKSDAVLFNLNNLPFKFPEQKQSNQKWINVLYEPIDTVNYMFLMNLKEKFDWSATYEAESDFVSLYYRDLNMVWKSNRGYSKNTNFSSKKNAIAALVNDCNKKNDHLVYLESLRKYKHVEIYGKCGKPCPPSLKKPNKKQNSSLVHECFSYLEANYKFIFSYEKRTCNNLVTNRFFDLLRYDIVPIVFKAFDHEKYIPRSGFINAIEFSTTKHLADYLLYLESNENEYIKFFEWKSYAQFRDNKISLNNVYSLLCDVCIKLNMDSLTGEKLNSNKNVFNNIQKYDSIKSCYRLTVSSEPAFFYSKILTDINESFISRIKEFFD